MTSALVRRSTVAVLGCAATIAAAAAQPSPTPREGTITSDGLAIHYLDWGAADRPVLVMLHGIFQSARTYDHIAARLTDDYRVIAMDLRGHGESDWSPAAAYTADDYARDLHALVGQLDLQRVAITGCSIGGRVAQVYAGLHPDRVSRVIMQDVGPARPESTTRTLTARVGRDEDGWASEEELFQSLRRNPGQVSEEIHRRQVQYETRRLPNGRIAWRYDPKVTSGLGPIELWSSVERTRVPLLYVVGGRSRLVTAAEQERLVALPHVEVVTIPDAGHYPHQDSPDRLVAVIREFLER